MPVDRYDFGGTMFSVSYEINRIVRKFGGETGLYSGQPRILTILSENEGATLSELSGYCGIGMASLSVSVRNMEKYGMIRKISQGRQSRLYLTAEGRKRALKFHEKIDKLYVELLESFGGGEELNANLIALVRYLETQ